MSPRQPTARKSTKNYSPAMRQYLVQLTDLAWQAQPLEGEYWQVLTAKGETLAIVNDTVTQANINAQQAAQLMADAPLLLKELLLAHHLLRDTVTRLFTNEKKVTFEDIKPTSERYDQRLRLLAKYRDLIENREADYAPLLANKEQGHD
ncbi:hypothetical protein [uncultured Agitococcus sp.]|uniref:hypothetical protein n=1 Tax=uncultured Agitococcus sp. TaxID=1506599 RepID=UPI00263646D8|nr:hypothetical protein [uncultured Agitococcus sp.]